MTDNYKKPLYPGSDAETYTRTASQRAREKKLPMVEMFGPTIQGEGGLIGSQTMFIRLGLCDYKCAMCDSKHAVNPQLVQQFATWMTQEEIGDMLLQTMKDAECSHIEWVSITGGNPCIHDLTYLVDYLRRGNMRISIETQGTKCPSWLEDCDQITVSPKSPGMGEVFDIEVFKEFLNRCDYYTVLPKLQIKIPIFSAQDIEFAAAVFDIARTYTEIPEDAYYLSVGNTCLPSYSDEEKNIDEDQKKNLVGNLLNEYNILSNLVMRDSRLSFAKLLPQLHVLVWGNEQCR